MNIAFFSENTWVKTAEVCENGQVWSDCAVNCKRACLYYYYTLKTRCKLGDVRLRTKNYIYKI